MLPDEALGGTGRKVRCAKCRETWFQKPPAVVAIPEPKHAAPPPVFAGLPVPKAKPSFRHEWVAFSLCFSWLIAASLYLFGPAIVRNVAFAAPLYVPLGVVNTQGVALYDTKIEKTKQYGRPSVALSGTIVNESGDPRRIPNLQITQKDGNGETLETSVLESGFPLLAPGQKLDYSNVMPLASQDVSHIVIDIGDAIELSRRSKK